MIVYGDRVERVRTADRLAAIAAELDAVAAMAPGLDRHGALVAAFIGLGQVVQGVADADRETLGADGGSAGEAALMPQLGKLAEALLSSWFETALPHPVHVERSSSAAENAVETRSVAQRVATGASRLRSMLLDTNGSPEEIRLGLPEGYAFYAVYPEAYAAAARRLVLNGAPRVIGIRSIGSGLGAIVAAVLGAPPPLTVRPAGHPFERSIALTAEAEAALLDAASHYVVVDEGPGLSGSSFAAVAQWLEARGIARDRIAFLPSHGGDPGTRASVATRTRWAAAQRPVVTMDELIPPERLAAWVARLVGRLDGPLEDISGGGWRRLVYPDEAVWPAVDAGQERRKYLATAGGARWLVKFAGLGAEGARKRDRACRLDGFVPEVRGLVHGFLVQRWATATPACPDIAAIARYLGARARLLPAAGGGASLAELFAMGRHNIGLALGQAAADAFAARHAGAPALQERVRAMATDNRLGRHEWLRLDDGVVLKADALDHDAAHDLIGRQDLAWDVAGAAGEFDLDADDLDRLIAATEAAAERPIDRALLAFLTPCYLAFRLGAAQLAADSLGGWPAEAARNRAVVARHAEALARLL